MGILDDAIREHLELKRRHGADTTEVSAQEREILGAGDSGDQSLTAEPTGEAELVADIGIDPTPAVAEPLAGSPLADRGERIAADDLFPGTGELEAAASEHVVPPPAPAPAPRAQAPAPAPRAQAAAPPLPAPAAPDADSETAARSGARRLSDDELAAWRRRLSERADRLAAQRPGGAAAQDAGPAQPAPAPPVPAPATPAAQAGPPAYWSGNQSGADVGAPPPIPAQSAPVPGIPEPPADGVPVDFFDAGEAGDAFSPEPAPEPEPVVPDHDVLDETPDFLEETPEHDRMWFEQRPPRDFDFG